MLKKTAFRENISAVIHFAAQIAQKLALFQCHFRHGANLSFGFVLISFVARAKKATGSKRKMETTQWLRR